VFEAAGKARVARTVRIETGWVLEVKGDATVEVRAGRKTLWTGKAGSTTFRVKRPREVEIVLTFEAESVRIDRCESGVPSAAAILLPE